MNVSNVAHAETGHGLGGRPYATSGALKRIYHSTFDLWDRLVHPHRHLAVCRRISNAPRPRRILVVCNGNLCRSPYLHAVLQRSLCEVKVTSAGFVASDRAVPQISVALSAQRGLDLSGYRSQPITQSKASEADLVMVMDAEQALRVGLMFGVERERILIVGDLEPMFAGSRGIADPSNQSAEAFVSTFDRLDRCADTFVSVLPPGK